MKNNIVLSGELQFLNLGDLIQLLGTYDSNGVLRITSQYAKNSGFIYFKNGDLVDAANGSLIGIDAVYSLFGWTEGTFEFIFFNIETEKKINQSRMEIILEGLRLLDDGSVIQLGPTLGEQDSVADWHSIKPLIKGPPIDYMYVLDEEEFSKGDTIVEENKFGNWMWVILNGLVEIIKETSQGKEVILRIGPGSFIGRLTSFLLFGDTRHATAVAVGNVQLGVLDSQRLSNECACMSNELKNIIMSLEKRLDQLTKMTITIGNCDNDLFDFIKSKDPFLEQGKKDARLFTITSGQAFVVRKISNGYVKLATLSKGDFVGHFPFYSIGHEPDAASVFVSKDIEIMPIDLKQIQKEYNDTSIIFKKIIEHTGNCISVTTKLACDKYQYG